MARKETYASIQAQIQKLTKQAEALRAQETKGVVERIKVAIDAYGLTAEDLGLTTTEPPRAASVTTKAPKKVIPSVKKKRASVIRYKDTNGNAWSGFGPKPRWLREALAGGAPIESFTATPDN
ncbi:H-NS family nucleoid-associated regulatory protein [Piscinibacter sakaiensis]|uniref:H-NS histone family protein n=1 Tax=Piscinibacter sakaiensis TaxID=1547922 RepID=UPI003AAC1732